MIKHEQDALLGYLEFNLTSMVEQFEILLKGKLNAEEITAMYDGAYEVLNEMERSLAEVQEHNELKVFHINCNEDDLKDFLKKNRKS